MPPTLRSSPEKGGGTRRSKRGLDLPTQEQKKRKKKSPTQKAPPKKAASKSTRGTLSDQMSQMDDGFNFNDKANAKIG